MRQARRCQRIPTVIRIIIQQLIRQEEVEIVAHPLPQSIVCSHPILGDLSPVRFATLRNPRTPSGHQINLRSKTIPLRNQHDIAQ